MGLSDLEGFRWAEMLAGFATGREAVRGARQGILPRSPGELAPRALPSQELVLLSRTSP